MALTLSGATFVLVSGWTSPLEFTLLQDGASRDLTGADVTLRLFDNRQRLVAFAGDFDVTIAVSGRVSFNPAETDLIHALSPYTARVRVAKNSGADVTYHPQSAADVWTVHPESK